MADEPGPTQLHRRAAEQVVTTLRVDVIEGPDRGKNATGDDKLAVGTARDNALVVSDFTVSRYHLELAVRPNGVLVTDLGSTNGSYVGGVRIERAVVPTGTPIKLGGTTIRFSDAERRTVELDRLV